MNLEFKAYPKHKPEESKTVLCIQKLTDPESKAVHHRYITGYFIEEEGFWTVDDENGIDHVLSWAYLEELVQPDEQKVKN